MNAITQHSNLTKRQAEVVQLLTEQNMSPQEIAETLSCGVDNVWKILRREDVKAEVVRRVRDTLSLGSVAASATLLRLAGSAKSEFVQMQSAVAILDRVGIREPEQDRGALQIQINLD